MSPTTTTIPTTMRSVSAVSGPGKHSSHFTASIINIPVPKPGPNEVLIRVLVAGTNPKDWKLVAWNVQQGNTGDDLAGIVAAVGSNVYEFAPGDRVGAFHVMMTEHGAFAEYAIAPAHTTFRLPHNVLFEDAASLPLAFLTAVQGMYSLMNLPSPLRPVDKKTETEEKVKIPFIVYGGSTAVGAFAIKLAVAAGIGPIIAVAGRGKAFVRSILPSEGEGSSMLVDYRDGNVAEQLLAVMERIDVPVRYVFDAVSLESTLKTCAEVLGRQKSPGGQVGYVLGSAIPADKGYTPPEGVSLDMINVGWSHDMSHMKGIVRPRSDGRSTWDLAEVMLKWAARAMGEGRFRAHPVTVIEGGLEGVERGLGLLEREEVSAEKLVYRVAEE